MNARSKERKNTRTQERKNERTQERKNTRTKERTKEINKESKQASNQANTQTSLESSPGHASQKKSRTRFASFVTRHKHNAKAKQGMLWFSITIVVRCMSFRTNTWERGVCVRIFVGITLHFNPRVRAHMDLQCTCAEHVKK